MRHDAEHGSHVRQPRNDTTVSCHAGITNDARKRKARRLVEAHEQTQKGLTTYGHEDEDAHVRVATVKANEASTSFEFEGARATSHVGQETSAYADVVTITTYLNGPNARNETRIRNGVQAGSQRKRHS